MSEKWSKIRFNYVSTTSFLNSMFPSKDHRGLTSKFVKHSQSPVLKGQASTPSSDELLVSIPCPGQEAKGPRYMALYFQVPTLSALCLLVATSHWALILSWALALWQALSKLWKYFFNKMLKTVIFSQTQQDMLTLPDNPFASQISE